MYQVESSSQIGRLRLKGIHRTVLLLGLTSFFTDISSEMVAATLPLYVLFGLGLAPLQFGLLDGLYQGSSALVRLAFGFAADRWQRHRDVAGLGYGLSALSKLGLLLLGGAWGGLIVLTLLDRIGKGIRTAPRDALIARSSLPETLAASFSIHRAMDTAGAMIGPLLAFGLLTLAPQRFDLVFALGFGFAIIGLAVLLFFVPRHEGEGARRPVVWREAWQGMQQPGFGKLVLMAGLLALFTLSDSFIYLQLQRKLELPPILLPLLAVGTALAYMLLALPLGRLADRRGRWGIFLAGYTVLLLVYAALLLPIKAWPLVALYLLALGAFYASTDGVLMAQASTHLPPEVRASGLALLTTVTSLARFAASLGFGALWTWTSPNLALTVFGVALLMCVLLFRQGVKP
jgi:MFS family permease